MGLLDKIVGTNKNTSESLNEKLDNTKLIYRLEVYCKNKSQENYQNAFNEIVEEQSLFH